MCVYGKFEKHFGGLCAVTGMRAPVTPGSRRKRIHFKIIQQTHHAEQLRVVFGFELRCIITQCFALD